MNRIKPLGTVFALAAAAALVGLYARGRAGSGHAGSTRASAATTIADERSVAASPPPRSSARIAEAQARPAPIAPADTPALPSHREPPAMDPSSVTMADAIGHVQTRFIAQPVDGQWTREMKGTVEEVLRAAARDGSALRAVECRAAICRVEIAHDDEARYRSFTQHVRELSDGEMAFTRAREADPDDWSMVVYVARPGTELPKLD